MQTAEIPGAGLPNEGARRGDAPSQTRCPRRAKLLIDCVNVHSQPQATGTSEVLRTLRNRVGRLLWPGWGCEQFALILRTHNRSPCLLSSGPPLPCLFRPSATPGRQNSARFLSIPGRRGAKSLWRRGVYSHRQRCRGLGRLTFFAPADEATRTAVGVARPRAQGQATTRTSMASLRLSTSASMPGSASGTASRAFEATASAVRGGRGARGERAAGEGGGSAPEGTSRPLQGPRKVRLRG